MPAADVIGAIGDLAAEIADFGADQALQFSVRRSLEAQAISITTLLKWDSNKSGCLLLAEVAVSADGRIKLLVGDTVTIVGYGATPEMVWRTERLDEERHGSLSASPPEGYYLSANHSFLIWAISVAGKTILKPLSPLETDRIRRTVAIELTSGSIDRNMLANDASDRLSRLVAELRATIQEEALRRVIDDLETARLTAADKTRKAMERLNAVLEAQHRTQRANEWLEGISSALSLAQIVLELKMKLNADDLTKKALDGAHNREEINKIVKEFTLKKDGKVRSIRIEYERYRELEKRATDDVDVKLGELGVPKQAIPHWLDLP